MNKKAIFASISVLILILVTSISVSAFQIDDSYTVEINKPNSLAITKMINVFQIQRECGFFPSDLEIISISFDSDLNFIFMIAAFQSTHITIDDATSNIRYYRNGARGLIPLLWTSDGWDFPYDYARNPSAFFGVYANSHYYSSIQAPDTPSYSGFIGVNSDPSVFGTSNVNADTALNYWIQYRNRLQNYDLAVSEAYSEGLATGQGEGYQVGLEDGYNQGYDSGFADGEDRGYAEGQTEGYSEGYSDGYSEGESVGSASGYRDGFDDGREEGYTLGYDVGYDDGFNRGEDIGHQTGYSEGYESGYSEGYSEGYDTGYNIVYDDLQEPGTIQAIFTTKDSSGNILYLAQEMDLANHEINYAFLPKDQLSNSYVGYRLYVKTYDVTQYLEKNPLDFDYPLPVIEYNDTDFLSLYRKVNVTREYFDLYSVYSFVEVKIDQTFIDQLHNEYNEGLNDANALVNGIGDIATKPIVSLKDALDFEIFGLNIGVVALGLVAILFAIWAYNKIRKILPI